MGALLTIGKKPALRQLPLLSVLLLAFATTAAGQLVLK
jgi:hypothetical protein